MERSALKYKTSSISSLHWCGAWDDTLGGISSVSWGKETIFTVQHLITRINVFMLSSPFEHPLAGQWLELFYLPLSLLLSSNSYLSSPSTLFLLLLPSTSPPSPSSSPVNPGNPINSVTPINLRHWCHPVNLATQPGPSLHNPLTTRSVFCCLLSYFSFYSIWDEHSCVLL